MSERDFVWEEGFREFEDVGFVFGPANNVWLDTGDVGVLAAVDFVVNGFHELC